MLLLALALAGCGSSAASLRIPFKSPALVDGALPAAFTCDGKDISPPLEWGAVPSSTRELAVFIFGLTPKPSTGTQPVRNTISVEWAVAGLNPALHRLAAGRLPPGAHVGRGSDSKAHYSICPAKGKRKRYQFALYAVPASVEIAPSFEAIPILRNLASTASPTAAKVGGSFVATYERR
jgi:hypothetical protein